MTDTLVEPEVTTHTSTYSVDYGPSTTTNGHEEQNNIADNNTKFVSRKQTQHTTQQITTTTKVIRELHHIGPDGKVVEYSSSSYPIGSSGGGGPALPEYSGNNSISGSGSYSPHLQHQQLQQQQQQPQPHPGYAMDPYRPHSPASETGSRGQYEGYPPTSGVGGYGEYDPYSRGGAPSRQEYQAYGQVNYPPQSGAPPAGGYTAHYPDGVVPTAGGYPQSGYAELDATLLPPNGQDPYRNTPSPGLHGAPQDRYDGAPEGEMGDHYPGDEVATGLPRGSVGNSYPQGLHDPRMGYPPHPQDGGVYGRLLGPPPSRSPYTINGAPSTPTIDHPLNTSGGPHYDQDSPGPPQRPPMHVPSAAPSPLALQNHDNYAHPSLLRSPSTDNSSAPKGGLTMAQLRQSSF